MIWLERIAPVQAPRRVVFERDRSATRALPVVRLAGAFRHGPFNGAKTLAYRTCRISADPSPGRTARAGRVPPPLQDVGLLADLIAGVGDATHGAEQLSLIGTRHPAQPSVELRILCVELRKVLVIGLVNINRTAQKGEQEQAHQDTAHEAPRNKPSEAALPCQASQ